MARQTLRTPVFGQKLAKTLKISLKSGPKALKLGLRNALLAGEAAKSAQAIENPCAPQVIDLAVARQKSSLASRFGGHACQMSLNS